MCANGIRLAVRLHIDLEKPRERRAKFKLYVGYFRLSSSWLKGHPGREESLRKASALHRSCGDGAVPGHSSIAGQCASWTNCNSRDAGAVQRANAWMDNRSKFNTRTPNAGADRHLAHEFADCRVLASLRDIPRTSRLEPSQWILWCTCLAARPIKRTAFSGTTGTCGCRS